MNCNEMHMYKPVQPERGRGFQSSRFGMAKTPRCGGLPGCQWLGIQAGVEVSLWSFIQLSCRWADFRTHPYICCPKVRTGGRKNPWAVAGSCFKKESLYYGIPHKLIFPKDRFSVVRVEFACMKDHQSKNTVSYTEIPRDSNRLGVPRDLVGQVTRRQYLGGQPICPQGERRMQWLLQLLGVYAPNPF